MVNSKASPKNKFRYIHVPRPDSKDLRSRDFKEQYQLFCNLTNLFNNCVCNIDFNDYFEFASPILNSCKKAYGEEYFNQLMAFPWKGGEDIKNAMNLIYNKWLDQIKNPRNFPESELELAAEGLWTFAVGANNLKICKSIPFQPVWYQPIDTCGCSKKELKEISHSSTNNRYSDMFYLLKAYIFPESITDKQLSEIMRFSITLRDDAQCNGCMMGRWFSDVVKNGSKVYEQEAARRILFDVWDSNSTLFTEECKILKTPSFSKRELNRLRKEL